MRNLKDKSSKVLLGMIMELCSITCNQTATEIAEHYRKIDAIKAELESRF